MTVKDQVLFLNCDGSTSHAWYCREDQMYDTIIELVSAFVHYDITFNEAHSVLNAMLGDRDGTAALLRDLHDRRSTRLDFVNRVCQCFFKAAFKKQESVPTVSSYANLKRFRSAIKDLGYRDKLVTFSPEGKQVIFGTPSSVFFAYDLGLTRQEFLDLQDINTRLQGKPNHV